MAFSSGSAVGRSQTRFATSANSHVSSSFTPVAGNTLYVWAWSFILLGAPATPSMSGTGGMSGATFTQVATSTALAAGWLRVTLFRTVAQAAAASTITASWGATNQGSGGMIVVEAQDAETGGTNGSNTQVQASSIQTGNSAAPAVTGLSSFQPGSGTLLFSIMLNSAGNTTEPEAGWTEIYDVSGMETAAFWNPGADTTPTHTINAAKNWGAIALEIAVASGGPPPFKPRLMLMGVG